MKKYFFYEDLTECIFKEGEDKDFIDFLLKNE